MMLDLRRLRLLRELSERGTIASVADALQFTPSAVSQQLAILEREAGVPLLERRGGACGSPMRRSSLSATPRRCSNARRSPRPTSPPPRGRSPAAGASPASSRCCCGVALPAIEALARDAPRLRCEVFEAEPEQALPALALGHLDLVLGDSGSTSRCGSRTASTATTCSATRCTSSCPRPPGGTPPPGRGADRRAGRRGVGHRPRRPGLGRADPATCRDLGGFNPDIRHRTTTQRSASRWSPAGSPSPSPHAAAAGGAPRHRPADDRRAAGLPADLAATRAADAARPSTRALLAAVRRGRGPPTRAMIRRPRGQPNVWPRRARARPGTPRDRFASDTAARCTCASPVDHLPGGVALEALGDAAAHLRHLVRADPDA